MLSIPKFRDLVTVVGIAMTTVGCVVPGARDFLDSSSATRQTTGAANAIIKDLHTSTPPVNNDRPAYQPKVTPTSIQDQPARVAGNPRKIH